MGTLSGQGTANYCLQKFLIMAHWIHSLGFPTLRFEYTPRPVSTLRVGSHTRWNSPDHSDACNVMKPIAAFNVGDPLFLRQAVHTCTLRAIARVQRRANRCVRSPASPRAPCVLKEQEVLCLGNQIIIGNDP